MGSELEFTGTPKFEVRAAGSFEQKPGCPPDVISPLGEERARANLRRRMLQSRATDVAASRASR